MPAPPGVGSVTWLLPPAHGVDLVAAGGQLAAAVGGVAGAAPVHGRGRVEVRGLRGKIPAAGQGRGGGLGSQDVRMPALEAQPGGRLGKVLLAGGQAEKEVGVVVVLHAPTPMQRGEEGPLGGPAAAGSSCMQSFALAIGRPGRLRLPGKAGFLLIWAGLWGLLRYFLDWRELAELAGPLQGRGRFVVFQSIFGGGEAMQGGCHAGGVRNGFDVQREGALELIAVF